MGFRPVWAGQTFSFPEEDGASARRFVAAMSEKKAGCVGGLLAPLAQSSSTSGSCIDVDIAEGVARLLLPRVVARGRDERISPALSLAGAMNVLSVRHDFLEPGPNQGDDAVMHDALTRGIRNLVMEDDGKQLESG